MAVRKSHSKKSTKKVHRKKAGKKALAAMSKGMHHMLKRKSTRKHKRGGKRKSTRSKKR